LFVLNFFDFTPFSTSDGEAKINKIYAMTTVRNSYRGETGEQLFVSGCTSSELKKSRIQRTRIKITMTAFI